MTELNDAMSLFHEARRHSRVRSLASVIEVRETSLPYSAYEDEAGQDSVVHLSS